MGINFLRYIAPVLLVMLTLVGIPDAMAQVDLPDRVRQPRRGDTTRVDTTRADSVRQQPIFKIIPWRYNRTINSSVASTDSLNRWEIWPDWTHKRNRDPGVISYRLGTVGRSNALLVDAHEPRHQELYWEDIPLASPVSGTINWSKLPIHKLVQVDEESGILHKTHIRLKQYYVNQPLSKLLFEESKFDRRALEFWVTQNFSQKTNAQLGYWDRRAGGGYPNSSLTGTQVFGRVYHHLDNSRFLKVRFLNGSRNLGEPFGYAISDLNLFPFNRFSTTPNESRAKSNSSQTLLGISYHRRPADSLQTTETLRTGLFMNTHKRKVSYSADTTAYRVRSLGAYLHKWVDWKPLKLEGLLRYELFTNRDQDSGSLDIGNWSEVNATAKANLQPLSWFNLIGEASLKNRDFDQIGFRYGTEARLRPVGRLELSAGISQGTLLPTVQQQYWSSLEYSGSENLNPEEVLEVHSALEIPILKGLRAEARAQLKRIENGIMLNGSNTFVNIGAYNSQSATAGLDFESRHFEIDLSGTIHQYVNALPDPANGIPGFNDTRLWMKGGAFWKGYLFDRATYVKAGVAGMFSPFTYRADHYTTVLDYWQPASSDQQLPWYSRLDLDISARVRSIMFVLRFENVLDDVSQLGYFETAGYPMPPRRFLFGVRALFNN